MTDCDIICSLKLLFLVLLILSLPSYVLCLFTIIRYVRSHFRSPFWALCISLGLADVAKMLHLQLAIKLPALGVFRGVFEAGGPTAASAALVIDHYLVHCQIIGVILITLNRYTAIVVAYRHKQIWSFKFLSLCIALQWVLPLLFISPILPLSYHWASVNDSSGIRPSLQLNSDRKIFHYYLLGNMIWSAVRVLLYTLSYIRMLSVVLNSWKFSRRTSTVTGRRAVEHGGPNARLGIVGLVLVVLDSLVFCTVLVMTRASPQMLKWCDFGLQALSETFSWINVWLLLTTSSVLRGCFLETLCCKIYEAHGRAERPNARFYCTPTRTMDHMVEEAEL